MYRNICVFGLFAIFMSALSTPIPDDELNQGTYEVTNEHQEQCLKVLTSGYDADTIKANENNIELPLSLQCLQLCYGKIEGLLHDNGTLIQVAIDGEHDADTATIKSNNSCSNIMGTDRCDTGMKTVQCLMAI